MAGGGCFIVPTLLQPFLIRQTMSGYRSLHRESVGSCPIWQVATSPVLATKASKTTSWRIWTASGDGLVKSYLVQEKEMQQAVLDASACSCDLTHVLLGSSQQANADAATALGCTQVRLARNYVGDDDRAGDLVVASLELSGRVRIWSLPENMDDELLSGNDPVQSQKLKAAHEFFLEDATGTFLQICPPKVSGIGDVQIAMACLDGTIAIVATGLATPKATKDPKEAGTILDRWSKPGSIAMSGDWHPSQKTLAVGRQDGLVEIIGGKPHRLIQHETPVRAVAYTPDGNLLVSASDEGMLCVWDVSRSIPVLVHHVTQAHISWVLSVSTLQDSRRFITAGADRKLNVWNVGQMDQAQHSFTSDDTVWTIHASSTKKQLTNEQPPRLVSGSEQGGLQIYSLEP
jgi:WD40 repeat protein